MQEVVFYEDGEPIIDGETGDLRVDVFPLALRLTYSGYTLY